MTSESVRSRPSAFDTTFWAMTTTSPLASGAAASTMSAARSSPGRISGSPSTPRSSIFTPVGSSTRQAERSDGSSRSSARLGSSWTTKRRPRSLASCREARQRGVAEVQLEVARRPQVQRVRALPAGGGCGDHRRRPSVRVREAAAGAPSASTSGRSELKTAPSPPRAARRRRAPGARRGSDHWETVPRVRSRHGVERARAASSDAADRERRCHRERRVECACRRHLGERPALGRAHRRRRDGSWRCVKSLMSTTIQSVP